MTGTRQPSAGMDGHGNASVTGTWMHTRFVSSANGKAGSSRRSRCITSSLWQRAVITAKQILCPYVLLVMRKFMQNVGIAGTITKGPGAVKISTALSRGNGRGVSRAKKAKSKG